MLDELIKALDKKLTDEGKALYSIVLSRIGNGGEIVVSDDCDGSGEILYSAWENRVQPHEKDGLQICAERIIKKLA